MAAVDRKRRQMEGGNNNSKRARANTLGQALVGKDVVGISSKWQPLS